MPKTPRDTVRVMGKEYEVDRAANLPPGVMGQHDQQNLLIEVKAGLPPHEARETLLHELIHAVDEQLGLRLTEKRVRQLSVGLYALLRDNSGLVKYLTKAK